MSAHPSGRYVTTIVAGESIEAFLPLPVPLPPRLSAGPLAPLEAPLRIAEAARARLDLAGEMIPSLDWFMYAFVRKEVLLSSEIDGTQATPVDILVWEQSERHGASSIKLLWIGQFAIKRRLSHDLIALWNPKLCALTTRTLPVEADSWFDPDPARLNVCTSPKPMGGLTSSSRAGTSLSCCCA